MDDQDPPGGWPELSEDFVAAASHHEAAAAQRRDDRERAAAQERAARLRAEEAAAIERGRGRARRERRRAALRRHLGWKALSAASLVALGFIAYNDMRPQVTHPAASVRSPGSSAVTVAPTTSTTLSLASRSYRPGDCVTWDQTPGVTGPWGRPTQVVPCSGPHLVEIASPAEQLDGFSAAWPGEAAIEAYAIAHCDAPVQAFLGYPLDPAGRFALGDIHPLDQAWADGDRTYYCVIQMPGPFDYLPSFSGEAKGADQEWLVAVGSCMATASRDPVPCSGPHQWEVTGDVTVPADVTALPATDQAWQAAIGAQCSRVGLAYAGGAYPVGYETGWLGLTASNWAAGERTVQCTVGRPQGSGAGSGWATTTGSLRRQ